MRMHDWGWRHLKGTWLTTKKEKYLNIWFCPLGSRTFCHVQAMSRPCLWHVLEISNSGEKVWLGITKAIVWAGDMKDGLKVMKVIYVKRNVDGWAEWWKENTRKIFCHPKRWRLSMAWSRYVVGCRQGVSGSAGWGMIQVHQQSWIEMDSGGGGIEKLIVGVRGWVGKRELSFKVMSKELCWENDHVQGADHSLCCRLWQWIRWCCEWNQKRGWMRC